MKKKSIVALLMCFIFLLSCYSYKSKENYTLDRKWMLTEFGDLEKEELVKIAAYIDLSSSLEEKEDVSYSAFMGCNRFFFTMKVLFNKKLSVASLASTLMYCDKNMNIEKKFGEEFPEMTSYEIKGNKLYLSTEKGNKMVFLAAESSK